MKICILAIVSSVHWVEPYVKAFRQVGDVLTVGPSPTPDFCESIGLPRESDLLQPCDITSDLGREVDLSSLFPPGWEPDLIVAIPSFGYSLNPDMRRLDCPRVYMSIDTWQSPLDFADALQFDFVFVAQKSFVPHLAATGSRNVFWLPLACDPEVHCPTGEATQCDISFVGSVGGGVHDERGRLLAALANRFEVSQKSTGCYGADYRQAICSGRLTFNHAAVNDLNMRIFEALAMGVPLLTNRSSDVNGLSDLFRDKEHLIIYHDEADLFSQVAHYLANPEEARALGEAGYREVLARHTYAHRVQEILATVSDAVRGFPGQLPHPDARKASLVQQIPRDARRVLDAGMCLGDDRSALQERGVEVLIGTHTRSAERRGNWDLLSEWPPPSDEGLDIDTAVIARLSTFSESPDGVIEKVARLLPRGGTLLIHLSVNELAQILGGRDVNFLRQWFRRFDVHLSALVPDPTDGVAPQRAYTLVLRKRTRRLREVLKEGLSDINVAYDTLQWVTQLPEDR